MQPPLNPITETERRVDDFYHEVIYGKKLSPIFYYMPIKIEEDDDGKIKNYMTGMKELFSSLPEEEILPALNYYLKQVSATKDFRKGKVLFYLLQYGILDNFLNARLLCETIAKCDFLTFDNEPFWCLSFKLINKVISRIDYKGVRDLLKYIMEKASKIKPANNISAMQRFRAIEAVFRTIFDRNAALLPSYLIMDELQKKMVLKTSYPHWKFCTFTRPFVNSFRPVAQMVTVSVLLEIKVEESTYGKSRVLPIVGHPATVGTISKIDPFTGTVSFKELLPYNKELFEPQTPLLRYILEQPYSREMVCCMLGVSKQVKQRCAVLESELVALIVSAMEKSENETDSMKDEGPIQLLWQHLSSQLIYFVLCQFASFPEIVKDLIRELKSRNFRKGRDHLMWILLQFISGSIQKNDISDFFPVMVLYDFLYTEKEPLPVPDVTKSSCTHAFAIISIYIHLVQKAHCDRTTFKRELPVALTSYFDYLQANLSDNNLSHSLNADYRVPLLCNAYSTNQECFTRPMGILVDALQGNQKQSTSLSEGAVSGPVKPLSMSVLDSLTVHTKMSLIHNIVTHVMKLAQSKSAQSDTVLSPALVETYSRLLVYSEIESLGIKGFITHLLPIVFRSHAWGILHTLLEMFSYRLHHIQPHYRVQLLNHLHSLAAVPQTNQAQLHLCVESTALKLIAGMSSTEVQSLLPRSFAEQKSLLSNESEELNKVVVLTIARAIHVTGSESLLGSWDKEMLGIMMQNTPHSWSSFTLNCFPSILTDFFTVHQAAKENKAQLKRSVEEEYRKWKTMSNENDTISHFSLQSSSPLFLCLLWKMLLDNDRISTIAYQILDRIGSRALSAHLRTFADFLVYEFANSDAGNLVNKYIDALNDLIWKCHVIQLDRLILCMALRSFETNDEAQVCFFIIHLLLLRPSDFKNRVYDFVKDNSPEHWKQSDWHDKHLLFHRGLHDLNAQKSEHSYLPVYFGNVCLRFLPVMDIVIHRFLELPTVTMPVEGLLDILGCLYKFHDRPLTYLYNTLHYYEQNLRDKHQLKKKLVSAIVGSLKDIHPKDWALSDDYIQYLQDNSEDVRWIPDHEYYVKLIGRLVDTINGKSPFPHTDWRFNEFPNQGAHALHVTCIELMALPVSTTVAGNNLLDIILKRQTLTIYSNIVQWMNAVALVLTALPQAFWSVLNDRILEVLQSPLLANTPSDMDPFLMFDFAGRYNSHTILPCSFLIGLTHSVWYHASIGQLCGLIKILKEKFKPAVKTEEQFLFMCHLVAPFLQRFYNEGFQYITRVTIELYEMLEEVDKNCGGLVHTDSICDLLYHIKYMFIGNSINNEIERSIRNLSPDIQRKLRFITHLNVDENQTL